MKTREQDLHVLKKVYNTGTPAERREASKSLTKIHRETNSKVIKTREKLIQATRSGDHGAMKRFNHQLMSMRRGR